RSAVGGSVVGARGVGGGGDLAGRLHVGRVGAWTVGSGESGWGAQWHWGGCGGGLRVDAVRDGRRADQAGGRGWSARGSASAGASGASVGDAWRGGCGGPICGRRSGTDRWGDAGECRGAGWV